jgi:hypothetical protein
MSYLLLPNNLFVNHIVSNFYLERLQILWQLGSTFRYLTQVDWNLTAVCRIHSFYMLDTGYYHPVVPMPDLLTSI